MTFCNHCGIKVVDGAKFCQKCGEAINGATSKNEGQRQQEYAGKILKCPNCGEVLKSFNANCPACGYELRTTKSTDSVHELSLRLEQIEVTRVVDKPRSIYKAAYSESIVSKTDEQKATLIRTFPIPNTKEDLLEFMILAQSNVDCKLYVNDIHNSARVVSDAWKSKFEQAYQKAKLTFGTDSDFSYVQSLYMQLQGGIKKEKRKLLIFVLVGCAIIFGWIPILLLTSGETTPQINAKEVARLESVVDEIESNLDKGKYKMALVLAESLNYGAYDNVQEREWKVKREYLIEQIIEEAAENGVILNRTPQDALGNDNASEGGNKVNIPNDDNATSSEKEPESS